MQSMRTILRITALCWLIWSVTLAVDSHGQTTAGPNQSDHAVALADVQAEAGAKAGADLDANRQRAESDNKDRMSAAEALRDIAIARDSLERLHAGYNRYTPQAWLATQWDALEARATKGIDRSDLYLDLSKILADLKCDHTKAELPKDLEEARNTEPLYLPFRFVLFDRKMYVDQTNVHTGLNRGDEVLVIDGRTIEWWLRQIEPLVPVDGDAEQVKPLVIAYSTEFSGPAFDHFAPFIAPIKSTVDLRISTGGQIRHTTLPRQTYPEYQKMAGEQRYSSNFSDSVRLEPLGEDAAYLAVDTFINYRNPVDPVAHLAPYFERIKKERRSRLIVDLRQNGGGSDDAQQALLSYLITKPMRQVEAMLTRFNAISDEQRQYLSTWERGALNPDPNWFEQVDVNFYKLVLPNLIETTKVLTPAEHAFDGQIIMLTGPSNSSGSTHLIATLKAAGHVTLVGERTGGAPTGATAGTIFFLTLPHSGIKIRIPALRTVIANAEGLPTRNGIYPDVHAPMTAEAYFDDRDPALEAAKQMLTP